MTRLIPGGKTRLAAALLALGLGTASQAHQGEPPRTFVDYGAPKASLPIFEVEAIDAAALRFEDEASAKSQAVRSGPVRYALPEIVSITPEKHGTWTKTDDGAIWRLEIAAPGATDLNFGFGRFHMPDGATLHVYSLEDSYFQGPYTKQHQQDSGELWTPVVPGERAVIELFVPTEAAFQPAITLTQVGRGYRDLFTQGLAAIVKQGSCNNDVVCSVGQPWADQIRSVAVYGTNGSTFCTGTLINNVEQDGRPFFLTADHCNITSSNASSVVTYWNFESPNCGQLSGGSLSDNTSGATLRARDASNDMSLLELASVPDASYNVYYAGWDARTSTAPQGSVGIHHPNTDEKAISFNDDPLTTGNSCIGGGGSNTHWYVDNWEDGTTEPGSSGSALFDPATQRLVGYLSGGTASCSNTGGYDCYGKMSVGWGRGLSTWLDPNGTGTRFVDGKDSGGTAPPPPPPPSVIVLENGDVVSGLSGGAGDWTQFKLTVPAGATNLQITMSGGSGDADLYTRFGAEPTTSSYDCRPYSAGNNESCPVATPNAGDYYIGIRGYSAYSNVTLSVSFDEAAPPAEGDGFTVTNLSGDARTWRRYTIQVPEGMATLDVDISGGSGDADLYVRYGDRPTTRRYNCRPYLSGNIETCSFSNPAAGTWHIGIRGYTSYSGVRLDAYYNP